MKCQDHVQFSIVKRLKHLFADLSKIDDDDVDDDVDDAPAEQETDR